MSLSISCESIRRRNALNDWLAECERKMSLRFPKIDFYSNHWPIRTLYQTVQSDWHFSAPFYDFSDKDVSYKDVIRCLVSEFVIAGKVKGMEKEISSFRLLSDSDSYCIFDLTLKDLRKIESIGIDKSRVNPASSLGISWKMSSLAKHISLLGVKGVVAPLGYHLRAEVKSELRNLYSSYQKKIRFGKSDILDLKIEAFNDAFNYMINSAGDKDDKVLSPLDCDAICLLGLLLCAPSRINEILCMSIDDFVTLDDYVRKEIGDRNRIHSAHQMLIVMMKGSKGGQWSAKPVLIFMMDVFHYCMKSIMDNGVRSRMLVEWYEELPDLLYLPSELEYLRGNDLSRVDVAKIMYLTETPKWKGNEFPVIQVFKELKGRKFKAKNPVIYRAGGGRNPRAIIDFLPWADVEELLLKNIRQAMERCRRVTTSNFYDGALSKMLFLFDRPELPYQPFALNYLAIIKRLKHKKSSYGRKDPPPTVFEKLGITIPINGKVQFAELDTHDPRRWLTTMALQHGEMLSDVLINKWANRCKLSQLKAYDFRTAESMASMSAMPDGAEFTELSDISDGLADLDNLVNQFGLQTAITTSHDAGIAVTSMDAIYEAVESRPVAKSSRGIIILYPQRFGVCLHQHHEKPCRNYSNDLELSCVTCNQGIHVKGHLPTNEEIRRAYAKLFNIIVGHLENLAFTHNRCVADDPAALGEHMLTLVESGLGPVLMEQLATELIEKFHQINHLLKDRLLARRLEQAFASRGVVNLLDDLTIKSGAMIKYHSQTSHAEPLMEIALEEHGGREQVERDEMELIANYPQLAPKSLGLTDERHLITPDDDEEGD